MSTAILVQWGMNPNPRHIAGAPLPLSVLGTPAVLKPVETIAHDAAKENALKLELPQEAGATRARVLIRDATDAVLYQGEVDADAVIEFDGLAAAVEILPLNAAGDAGEITVLTDELPMKPFRDAKPLDAQPVEEVTPLEERQP